jgi:hypothetical protein
LPPSAGHASTLEFGLAPVGASFLGKVQLEQQGNRLTLIPPK